ncbi:MAG: hypothetical protein AAGF87_06105, partial [Bacteroidota bacterium]
ALAYDFLLRLLRHHSGFTNVLMRRFCHRTGERYRNASIPLYRFRAAVALALFTFWAQSSG